MSRIIKTLENDLGKIKNSSDKSPEKIHEIEALLQKYCKVQALLKKYRKQSYSMTNEGEHHE